MAHIWMPLAVLLSLSAIQEEPPRCRARDPSVETQRYLSVVTLYRQGDVERAVERMRELHPSDFGEAIGALREAADSRTAERCLEAAALVHTEAALKEKNDLQWSKATVHLDAARKLIASFPSAERRDAFFKDWLLAMAWLHQSFIFNVNAIYGFTEAQEYFGEALDRFPDDAEILLATGTLFEWAGSLRLGEAAHLERAEELYAKSLTIDSESVEANLRYGCVLEKRGKFEDARATLMHVLELPAGDVVLYRAYLILGSLAERRGRLREAREYYEKAIEIRPDWQVAHIALGHCLHRIGARARSKRVLEAMFSLPRTVDAQKGWFRYERGLSERLESHLERMRQGVAF